MSLELLSKIVVGGQELSNRLVLAPMTRARYVVNVVFSSDCMYEWENPDR